MRSLRADTRIVALDLLVVGWVAVCAVLGVRVHAEVRGLLQLSTAIADAGAAVERTGQALGALDLPLAGKQIDRAAQDVTGAGRDTRVGASSARDSIASLSTLLGFAVALIPAGVVLLLYLPARIARIRGALAAPERRLDARPSGR